MSNFKLHPSFQLNGEVFDSQLELITYAEGISDALYWFLQEWFSDSETLIVKTSGSTGVPKLIAIKKEFMENSAKATGSFFDIGAGTKALCCLSTEYIAGKMMIVRALTLGWELDIVEPVSNPLENAFNAYDFCAMVPMQVKASLWDLHLVKKLLIGGGVVSANLQSNLERVSTKCFASYGMTETVTHIAIKKLNNYTKEEECYQLLPNISISKDDRECLVIEAPLLADEPVITNDVVRINSDTTFEWLGRFDNVINSGGVKLHPEEIEKKLSKLITQRFFVIGIPDELLGEKLILIVEGDTIKIDLEDADLSKYEQPKAIYFVKAFVETETKKIQRLKTLDLLK